ncbi:S41 family peptidase [Asticcacaulis benevestitus]|uniref:Tail specific protease domain-containing protein n=1 Tax=Asticcacaulis benevestitus DSM 16100 = ATCC BAA-896 TaxID=1121022 RepID=V4PNG0_9CAUL|nr:S41 family peptidase [Asticcacaulis benevestitus]ESQ87025.1 hypothetical protein ABENE_17500 [Asticcacaulis benevestitus DSM 16100 = ATCC BAA-896]
MRIRGSLWNIVLPTAWLVVAGIASSVQAAAPPSPGFDPAAWRADYDQLKHVLEQNYSSLSWYGSPEGGLNLPRLDHQTRTALAAARSDSEARRAIEQFVTAFRGGHFQVQGDLAPAATPQPSPVAARPIDVTDPEGTCAALGFNPNYNMAFSVPFEALPEFKLTGDGMHTVWRTGLANVGGTKVGIIRLQKFAMRGFPATCTLAWAKLAASHAPITSRALRDAAYLMWYSSFGDEIAKLRNAGAALLVIDVGNNTGGDDSGDIFPRLLTDKPVRSAQLMVTSTPAGAAYFDEQIEGIDDVLGEHPSDESQSALNEARTFFVKAKAEAAAPCDLSWVWREQRPWHHLGCTRLVEAGYAGGYKATLPRGAFGSNQDVSSQLSLASGADDIWAMWAGPVYVVTDGKTYSSAEMFSAVIQDNGIGKTVGVKTGGDGCGFMGGDKSVVLDHSHIRLRIPNCVRLRRDGGNEVSGISPDLPVVPTEGEDDRQRAERMLHAVVDDAPLTNKH